jgi:predicted lipoprotein with Yx(FWY)xxD motif
MKTILSSTLALGLFAGVALAAPVKTMQTSLGDVLAGENGMTLYTFKKDAAGVSNCNDDCAKNWPPLAATAEDKADGAYSIITRADGSLQWAKDGMALYFWVKDAKPGDTTGHGVKEVWEVAKP